LQQFRRFARRRSDVSDPIARSRDLSVTPLMEELVRRFEKDWKAARAQEQRPRIEQYLTRVPESAREELLRDLLALEIGLRRHLDETFDLNEYCQRFPGYAEVVGAVFARHMVSPSPLPAGQDSSQLPGDTGPEPAGPRAAGMPVLLGRYRITEQLGVGGFGVVYKAYDAELQREVAIKVPHPHRISTPKDTEAYLREARILASLDHPGIVPVYDVGRTEEGLCYLVSKFVEGKDLAAKIRHARYLLIDAVEIVARVAEALHHAHQRGLVHRDVKPGNILLDGKGHPLVADFGLALHETNVRASPNLAGTPAYMSPEQARGEGHRIDARTDVYSLGVVFYELLTGQRPFAGDPIVVLELVIHEEVRPPRQLNDLVPKELDRICLKALSKRAVERYSTAIDLAEDLRHWQSGDHAKSIGHTPVPAFAPPRSPEPATLTPPAAAPVSDHRPTAIIPKGLRSFDAADADFFLDLLPGPRDRNGLPDTVRFWKRHIESTDPEETFSVGLLYGPSGCGKSSFVKAGLLPRLAESVLTIYVEATGDKTESRLLAGLRKRCPAVPPETTLADVVADLRRGLGLGGKKTLLVLDQFEQWLHANREQRNTELVRALRQCDGQNVQALVLVRDDFWMATTRFMADLEIPLLEGQNSAAVDLFDLRHAHKILCAFGRAFGALPEGKLSAEQERFLVQATTGLAQEGKVISVRLSLFAEMIKGKPWTPATLKELGGIEGIGVTFLEETFSAATAPPEHRLHQKAARAVLKSLLPELGTDIKGQMRSYAQLLDVSGYSRRPKDLERLMRLLDSELRLVTPTDPESIAGEEDEDRRLEARPSDPPATGEGAGSKGPYYQLTHDYLVPALRQWLTRKQRETRRGRAELRLAERTAQWSGKRDKQQMPPLSEWIGFRLFTRKRDWTPVQRKMMRSAGRRHGIRSLVRVALLGVLAWSGYEVVGRFYAHELLQQVPSAQSVKLAEVAAELQPYKRWAKPMLLEMSNDAALTSTERAKACVILLQLDPAQLEYVCDFGLQAKAPDDFRLIANVLATYCNEAAPHLWTVLRNPMLDQKQRYRAMELLFEYDPKSPQWQPLAPDVAALLTSGIGEAPTFSVPGQRVGTNTTTNSLAAVIGTLGEDLSKIFLNPHQPSSARVQAMYMLGEYAVHNPDLLAEVIKTELRPVEVAGWALSPERFHKLETEGRGKALLASLEQELDRNLPAHAREPEKEALAKRQARSAMALAAIGRADRVWPLLRRGPDPRTRAYLTSFLRTPYFIEKTDSHYKTVVARLASESDPGIRMALILTLQSFPINTNIETLGPTQKLLISTLTRLYRDDPDPGVHSAVGLVFPHRAEEEALPKIQAELASTRPVGNRDWYLTKRGHTFAVVRGPVEFVMGSPEDEPGHSKQERQHYRRIGRSFAISTTEANIGEFRGQRRETLDPRIVMNYGQSESITWYDAARYCRWLSEKEGMPEAEMCYPPLDQIKPGMRMPADYLSRTGYRLPTEAEWEYACRAGTVTSRSFGDAEDLLPSYAHLDRFFMRPSLSANDDQTPEDSAALVGRGVYLQPSGGLVPNDLGLFDMYGNACEWCQDIFSPYPRGAKEQPGEDLEGILVVSDEHPRILRGGSAVGRKSEFRSAYRASSSPSKPPLGAGFRVARTIR
jgi:serine/threonine protein kinase/formylglycine-generating enzyme required for sulfatase activity